MLQAPRFSVIIPAYNAASYIGMTLDSVRRQTFTDFEICVTDDGSKDGTFDVLNRYAADFPEIALRIATQTNKGIGAARNNGLLRARGEFIAFLDADDIWLERKLERMHAVLSANPAIDVLTHDETEIHSTGERTPIRPGSIAVPVFETLLYNGNQLSTSGTVVRRSLAVEVGGFSEDMQFNSCEDYEFWLRLAKKDAQFDYLPELLGEYHRKPNSISLRLTYHYGNLLNVVRHHFAEMDRDAVSAPSFVIKRRRFARLGRIYLELRDQLLAGGKRREARMFGLRGDFLRLASKFELKWAIVFLLRLPVRVLRGLFRRMRMLFSRPRRVASNLKQPYKFALARTALKMGLAQFDLSPGDQILVPAYICNVVPQALEEIGLKPAYYLLSESLEPDWADVEGRLNEKTKALLMVHFFGQPQNIPLFQKFANRHKLILIDDNAHGFGASVAGQALGTFGDIGVASPRKLFPMRNGGLLYSRRPLRMPKLPWQATIPAAEAAQRAVQSPGEKNSATLSRPEYEKPNLFQEPIAPDCGMDAAAWKTLCAINLDQETLQRRSVYSAWSEIVADLNLRPVFDQLREGASPQCFPAYADAQPRSELFDLGARMGLDIHSWPSLPEDALTAGNQGLELWSRIVCFPIRSDMDPNRLKSDWSEYRIGYGVVKEDR